jgi:dipeptidyl aminopeptidase/acylaminoacyl peptidase
MPSGSLKLIISLTITSLAAAPLLAESAPISREQRGAVILEDIPATPHELVQRLQPYLESRSASLQDWLHDGSMLVSTRFGEASQIHRVAFPGAARQQLTFFAEPVGTATVSSNPQFDGFVLSRDTGGNENHQLYWINPARGSVALLSDGRSRNQNLLFSRSGDRFAYASTRRNQRDFDIYVATSESPDRAELVLQVSGMWSPAAWSPDERSLLLRQAISATESRLFLLELASRNLREIRPSAQPVAFGGVDFSPDGKSVFLVSDEQSEFHRLRRLDLSTGNQEVLTADLDWDIERLEISSDGTLLAFVANEGGISQLYLMNVADGSRQKVPGLPRGVIGRLIFSHDDSRLGFTASSSRSPGDAFSLNLATRSLDQWTFSEAGGLQPGSFIEPELITYPTFDQAGGQPRQIPAFYYRAPESRGPAPVIINIHGGPAAQARPTFNPTYEFYLRELGIAVLDPNVRGSSGYGREYLELDDGRLREDSVRDIGALIDWIATRPELDSSRIAVMGGSYGGYMTLASAIRYGDRLKAGISTVGITNFVTFLENTADYRRDHRRNEYGDESDPAMRAFLHEISPLTRAAELNIPMLIAQGLNDPRVPASEATQMVDALRSNGRSAWYFLATDEGHGFRRKSNADLFRQVVAHFLQEHLIGSDAVSAR